MKLLLLGNTESEGGDDPWPIMLPGEKEPISSAKIGEYFTSEFSYYYRFYQNTKHSGSPFSTGWTSWPAWVPQLILYFDNTVEQVRTHNEIAAYKKAGINNG